MSPALASTMIKFLFVLAITKVWTQPTNPSGCLNGGISEINRCRCPEFTTGTRCQTILESITIGKSFEAKMKATLIFNYTGTQANFTSAYNTMMNTILDGLNGRHVAADPKFNSDGVTVTSDIFFTIVYDNETEVSEDYEEKYNRVLAAFNERMCKSWAIECIKTYKPEATLPPSKKDICAEKVTSVYSPFFDPVVNEVGLSCVSKCAPGSPDIVDCNDGTCQILGKEGPQCFCPRTDKYLYTYPRCGGAVSIVALYGGVGASIGLLVIVGIVLGVFFYRKKYYY